MRVGGWVGVGLRGAGGEMQEDGREVGSSYLFSSSRDCSTWRW